MHILAIQAHVETFKVPPSSSESLSTVHDAVRVMVSIFCTDGGDGGDGGGSCCSCNVSGCFVVLMVVVVLVAVEVEYNCGGGGSCCLAVDGSGDGESSVGVNVGGVNGGVSVRGDVVDVIGE